MKKRGNAKKKRINKKRLISFLLFLLLIIFILIKLFTTKIKNIYIIGNSYLSDQEIIDLAGIKNYPKSISNLSSTIKKRLEKSDYIINARITKKHFLDTVYIYIDENYPLFYYLITDKYVMYDGKEITNSYTCPTVVNQIPNTIYNKFTNKIKLLDKDILYRISEIKYDPNDVDSERFLLLMTDGNYVYITINKFLSLNKYVDMINTFDNKKGILHLDSGEYFDIFDE